MNTKSNDMTRGGVMRQMLMFALPLMLGNILQQCYNIADRRLRQSVRPML